jgi:hypothetical protein
MSSRITFRRLDHEKHDDIGERVRDGGRRGGPLLRGVRADERNDPHSESERFRRV